MADTLTLPATEEYRVVSLGARYIEPQEGINVNTGEPIVQFQSKLATRGQKVNLTKPEAKRLSALGVVLPSDAPLTYDEMTDDQLARESARRGLTVRGQGLNGEAIREDHINALHNSDRGRVIAASDPSGVVTVTSGPDVGLGSGGHTVEALLGDQSYDVAALSEQIKGGDGKALTVDETVALAGDDPQAARAVLEAEATASGGDSRKGVVDRLQPIADRA